MMGDIQPVHPLAYHFAQFVCAHTNHARKSGCRMPEYGFARKWNCHARAYDKKKHRDCKEIRSSHGIDEKFAVDSV